MSLKLYDEVVLVNRQVELRVYWTLKFNYSGIRRINVYGSLTMLLSLFSGYMHSGSGFSKLL